MEEVTQWIMNYFPIIITIALLGMILGLVNHIGRFGDDDPSEWEEDYDPQSFGEINEILHGKGERWECEYCGGSNSDDVHQCEYCGAVRKL